MENFKYANGSRTQIFAFISIVIIAVQRFPWDSYGLVMKIFGGLLFLAIGWVGILLIFEVVCILLAGFVKFLLEREKEN